MKKPRMKYLYVLGSVTIATYSFMNILKDRYDISEHTVYIPMGRDILKVQPQMGEFDNIIYPSGGLFRNFVRELIMYYRAEHVILHGLFIGTKKLLPILFLLLLFPNRMSRKLSWIEHGGDLYNWEYPHQNWKKPFIDWMNRKIRISASVLGVCHPMDERVIRETFATDAPCFYTQMRTMADPFEVWESVRPQEMRFPKQASDNYCYRIQVGHNAFQLGNHIRILDMLEKFKDENIRLIMPMNYGMTGVFGDVYGGFHYRTAVNQVAQQIFGDKAHQIVKKMQQPNYFRYLWGVDIVIFGLYRQAALGNIHPLLYMNKKIFLPSKSVVYQWMKEQGLDVYDTDEIPNMTFEKFVSPPSGKNRAWITDFLTKNSYGLWDSYFEALDAAVNKHSSKSVL